MSRVTEQQIMNMKNSTRKLLLTVLSLSALGLSACGDNGGNGGNTGPNGQGGNTSEKCPPHAWGEWTEKTAATESTGGVEERKCSKCGQTGTRETDPLGWPFKVKINGTTETIRSGKPITKPEDPAAPAGKEFFGWKNVKNGGQIWNFDNETLNKVWADVELEPMFIDAGLKAQYLEAEFCPAITADGGMSGATYSGGAKGKQLVREDADYEYGSSCEQGEFAYYKNGLDIIDLAQGESAPEGKQAITYNPKESNSGYFVHFCYAEGNTLVWNINASAAAENVVLVASYSAEYGMADEKGDKTYSIDKDIFQVIVNDVNLDYGTVAFHNIPEVGDFLPFQDFVVSTTVSLKEGANVIKMKVNNNTKLFSTIQATAPCIDALKLYTSATITWSEAKFSTIIK